jgi:hypothetical protein
VELVAASLRPRDREAIATGQPSGQGSPAVRRDDVVWKESAASSSSSSSLITRKHCVDLLSYLDSRYSRGMLNLNVDVNEP